jgi:DNA invertase Pin-like site-specific DNA recombinase
MSLSFGNLTDLRGAYLTSCARLRLGIDFVSFTEQMDTSTPVGQMIFTVLGAVSALERGLIVERVKAGLRNARAKGKQIGRPKVVVDMRRLVSLRDSGASWPTIAKSLGIGTGTAHRAYQGLSKTPAPLDLSKTLVTDAPGND